MDTITVTLTKKQAEVIAFILSQWNGRRPAKLDGLVLTCKLLDGDDGAHGFAAHLEEEAQTVMHYCEEGEGRQAVAYAKVCQNAANKIWSALAAA
jgi:hypothetical protein